MLDLQTLSTWIGIDYFTNTHKRIYWLFILSAICISFLYLTYNKESLSKYLKPSYWLHPSATLDYRYFVLVSLIKVSLVFPIMLSISETSLYVLTQLQFLFGYHSPISLNREVIIFLYTLTLFISGDFTRYWLHRWLHSSNILWQFHKVHHSAEVLTPITFYRVHPVENILFGLRYALITGLVTGIFIYLFGARLQLIDILGVNIFIFISLLLGANLRHSPIALAYPMWLENLLISPAQHQRHHTVDGMRSNYAGVLAIWDKLFNSLQYSDKSKLNTFGLPLSKNTSETRLSRHSYTSLYKLIINPFINSYFLYKDKANKEISMEKK